MKMAACLPLVGLMALSLAAGEVDTFVIEVEGLVCEESSHAVEEALDGIANIVYVEVNLQTRQVAVDAKPGKVKAEELIKAINAAQDSQGSFKAELKKGPKPATENRS